MIYQLEYSANLKTSWNLNHSILSWLDWLLFYFNTLGMLNIGQRTADCGLRTADCGLRTEGELKAHYKKWHHSCELKKFEQKIKRKRKLGCNGIWTHDLYDTTIVICADGFLLQVANTYAFLPREAVSYYLMSCSTCKQRIQRFNSILLKHGRPLSPVSDLVSVVSIATQKVNI